MRLYRLLLAAVLAPAAAQAQYYGQDGSGYARIGCTEDCAPSQCRQPPPQPRAQQQADQQRVPEEVAQRAALLGMPLPGTYAVPQATGEQIGESGSVGVRGLELRIPEMRFALPELRLPSCYRVRHQAEMRVAESRAPFVVGQAATYGMTSPGGMPLASELSLAQLSQPETVRPRSAPEEAAPQAEQQRAPQPPCPPPYYSPPPQYRPQPPCHDVGGYRQALDCAPAPATPPYPSGYWQAPPAPTPMPTSSPSVPLAPVPEVGELERLRQQLALQQQVIAQLQKSMELTQRGLEAAIAPTPAVGSPSAPQPAVMETPPSAPQHVAVAERSRGGIWPSSFQMLRSDGWIPQEEVPPVVRQIAWGDE